MHDTVTMELGMKLHNSTGHTEGWAVIAVRVWLVIVRLMQVTSSRDTYGHRTYSHSHTLIPMTSLPSISSKELPTVGTALRLSYLILCFLPL